MGILKYYNVFMVEVKQVTIYLQLPTHKQLKMAAVEKETSISQIIQELAEQYLKEEKHE